MGLEVAITDPTYTLTLDRPDVSQSARGSDLFVALESIRPDMEHGNRMIVVQGARRDAYTSGMLRDMIGARRVYIVQPGRQAEREYLVDIFAGADIADLGTVQKQKEFCKAWRATWGNWPERFTARVPNWRGRAPVRRGSCVAVTCGIWLFVACQNGNAATQPPSA
jgi:hypothetical protein